MLWIYNATNVDNTQLYLESDELQEKDKRAFVIFDTSTGPLAMEQGVDRYTWRSQTDIDNRIYIDDNKLYPSNQQLPGDYDSLSHNNFVITSLDEFYVLLQVAQKVDLISRRLPSRFQKKFSYSELATLLDRALWFINLTHPITSFTFRFSKADNNERVFNDYNRSPVSMRVPRTWWPLLVDGAVIEALQTLNILEVDLHFQYTDQGINLNYNNAQGIQSIWTQMLNNHIQKVKSFKNHYRTGRAVGTSPILGTDVERIMGSFSTPGIMWYLARR